MSDRDDIRQPQDHLKPQEERDIADEVDEQHYPGTAGPDAEPAARPETAAEPDRPARHGVAKLPPSGA